MNYFSISSLNIMRGDLNGGLTAAIVALPLALAFGVTSGAGPMAGLYGAIFVGFFAALFGGTPSQISGPTGPMTVVMAVIISEYSQSPSLAFLIVILGGIFQIFFGFIRLGQYIDFVPYPVISGFMSGIGCIIIFLQSASFLGHSHPGFGVIDSLLAFPLDIQTAVPDALCAGALSLFIVYFCPKKLDKIIPAPLLALFFGTISVIFFFPNAPVLGEIPIGFPEFQIPYVNAVDWLNIIGFSIVLAILGSLDSLLTSLVADRITRNHHQSNRELIGQGIANIVAGFFGAIPGAGATMRTIVNIRSGGRTPLSGMIHAMILLLIALVLGPIASKIPHSVLAAILIKIGIDIIDWSYIKRFFTAPKAGVSLMILVLFTTVFVDLIIAVTAGVLVACLLFVKKCVSFKCLNSN